MSYDDQPDPVYCPECEKEVSDTSRSLHTCEECSHEWDTSMPIDEEPSQTQLEEWSSDGVCEALDGCRIEPDGVCQHGYESWLRFFGYI